MLFNYHLKEMSRQCAFSSKTNKTKTKKKCVGARCDDYTAPTEVGTEIYCTLEKTDSPSETGLVVKKE